MSKIQQLYPTTGGAAKPADDLHDGRLAYAAGGASPPPRPIAAPASPQVCMDEDGLIAEAEWLAGVAADAQALLLNHDSWHDAAGTDDALRLLREAGADDDQPRPVAAALDGYSQLVDGVLQHVVPGGAELSLDLAFKVLRIARACWHRTGSDGLPRRFPLLLAAHEGYLCELLKAFDHYRFNTELHPGDEVWPEALVRSGLVAYRLPGHVRFAVLAACCLAAFDRRRCAFAAAIQAVYGQVFTEDFDQAESPVLRMQLMALASRPTPSGMGEFSSDQQASVGIFCEEAERDLIAAEGWLARARREVEVAEAAKQAAEQAVKSDRSRRAAEVRAKGVEKAGRPMREARFMVAALFIEEQEELKRRNQKASKARFAERVAALLVEKGQRLEVELPDAAQIARVWLANGEIAKAQQRMDTERRYSALRATSDGADPHSFAVAELVSIQQAHIAADWAKGLTVEEVLVEWLDEGQEG